MKVLFICGVFAQCNQQEIAAHARRPVEYSANIFQEKLIRGFEKIGVETHVVSAPFIGSFPNASDIVQFRGFEQEQSKYHYVPFNNIWGIRNFSRAASLKKSIRQFVEDPDSEKLIVVYCPHTPFLEAAAYAKKKDPRIKVCLVVPDLPQYMNLDSNVGLLYRIAKKYDVSRIEQLNRYVDSYMLLTEPMKEKLPIGSKPYCVIEGIIDDDIFEQNEKRKAELIKEKGPEKYIVYTGKMNEKFGVLSLLDAFSQIQGPDYRLVLCGCGDCDAKIHAAAQKDPRILALGQVTPQVAHDWILKADVLVNPRENNEEYTKYSFPSKNIEYLASGNPVVAYMLDGMPECYEKFLFSADDSGLSSAISAALCHKHSNSSISFSLIENYFRSRTASNAARHIIQQSAGTIL